MSTIDPVDPLVERGVQGMTPGCGEADRAAAAALLRMIWGIHISRCVYAVAELGIADLLAEGPARSSELARATGAHEPSLYRVLRMLASLGMFEEHGSRAFGLTAVGELCVAMPPRACACGPPSAKRSAACARSSTSWRRSERANPDWTSNSGRASSSSSRSTRRPPRSTMPRCPSAPPRWLPASPIPTTSQTLARSSILVAATARYWPRSCDGTRTDGILLEIPPVAARAGAVLGAIDAARWEVVAGNFFERVPEGADCYMMANVLHDLGRFALYRDPVQLPPIDGNRRQGADRRAPDSRRRRRPSPHAPERHQHARDYRR